jgi:hypothetical protein
MSDHFRDTTKMVRRRIQRSRAKGWRMPEGAVYVGRPTLWGNPWVPCDFNDRWMVGRLDPASSLRMPSCFEGEAVS